MPRKINPISYRLGLLQLWNSNITTYSNSINFIESTKNYFLDYFIKSFLKRYNLEVGSLQWVVSSSKIFLIVTCVSFFKKTDELNVLTKKLSNLLLSLYNLPIKIYLLKGSEWSCTSEFLKCYFEFKLAKSSSLKQVLKQVVHIIKSRLNTKKIVCTSYGPVLLRLKGFKVKSTGRFPNSRNQMSQSVQDNVGCITLSELNNYVEYSQTCIFTKSGIYSIHIWLLYTI